MNTRIRRIFVKGIVLLGLVFSSSSLKAQGNFVVLRKRMVEEQIISRGVRDENVIQALLKVPRHEFIPASLRHLAYSDSPLPIGYDQTISQPYIVALMTELLQLHTEARVLEIGSGSGYQAAVLAEIVKEVYTIEIIKPLAQSAEKKLNSLGYDNVTVKQGDGFLGWDEYAPFDAIIVTCAPKVIPPILIKQLKNGGRMVIPVGEQFQSLKLVVKEEGEIDIEDIIPVRFVPMLRE
jgi:protein-L-isoaspartate(D-aspartate) O-methyltransferase